MALFKKKEKKTTDKESDFSSDITSIEDIIVHVMPERFRSFGVDAQKAKKTGIFILISGVIFLIGMSALLYYGFFVYEPADKITEGSSLQDSIDIEVAQRPEPEDKPPKETDNSLITEGEGIATTTPDEEEGIATTTPDEEEGIATTTPDEGEVLTEVTASKDTDGDGLTDSEEFILGSDIRNFDSDSDGYADISELNNLYNPAGLGLLEENPRISKFIHPQHGYLLLYPNTWSQVFPSEDSAMFQSADNQFIQISIQENVSNVSIIDWFKQTFNKVYIDLSRVIEHKAPGDNKISWRGIKNDDGLTIYLTDSAFEKIYTINYSLGLSNELKYINIFEMIIDSFNIPTPD